MTNYPKRERSHFSRFTRAIFAAEVPKRFGTDVTTLVLFVASEEFRLFGAIAPAYWFSGMKASLGFGGNDRLLKAIKAAMDAGLLHYDPKLKPAQYWTIVPDWLRPFYDADHSRNRNDDSTNHSQNRNRNSRNRNEDSQNRSGTGNGTGNHSYFVEDEDIEKSASRSLPVSGKVKPQKPKWSMPQGVDPEDWDAWLSHRRRKRCENTKRAWAQFVAEVEAAGWTIPKAVTRCAQGGAKGPWLSFRAEWVAKESTSQQPEYELFEPRLVDDPIKPRPPRRAVS